MSVIPIEVWCLGGSNLWNIHSIAAVW
jgi:hypothetical protein